MSIACGLREDHKTAPSEIPREYSEKFNSQILLMTGWEGGSGV